MRILGLLSLCLICLVPFEARSSQTTGHQEGQRFANTLDRTLSNKVGDIPGYAGSNPQEARFRASQLSNQAESALRDKNSAAGFLLHSESNRAQFDIDPNKDPLLKASHGAVSNAEGFLNLETEAVEDQPTEYVEVKCIKPLEFTFTIDRRYTPDVKVVKKTRYLNTTLWGKMCLRNRCSSWYSTQFQDPYVQSKRFSHDRVYKFTINDENHAERDWTCFDGCTHYSHHVRKNYETYNENIVTENWTTSFNGFESVFENGDVNLIQEDVLVGPSSTPPREEGEAQYGDNWHIQETYMSMGDGPDTCSALLEKGCEQTSSVCIEEINGHCVKVENTFRCPDKVRRLRRSKLNGDGVFCLDGNCTDVAWQDNTDMMDALSKLVLFQEMQKNMKEGRVFKGNKMSCSKHCWGFSNCCQVSGGWGESIGLTKCSETEKELALLRGEKKCRYVGTYCAEKINLGFTKVCIMKKSSYCCFGNKLTRLIQEQGRSQLKMGWGSAKCPNCRGLTAEELTAIDFDQLDLQEAFEDIQKSLEIPNPSGIVNRFESNWKNRLPRTQEKVIQHREQGKDVRDLKVKYGESL